MSNDQKIQFKRVNSDANGNPRFVCHFLNLNTREEVDNPVWCPIGEKYNLALDRARKIGGKKFSNKQYGGGIVFQSYSLPDTVKSINEITGHNYTGYTV